MLHVRRLAPLSVLLLAGAGVSLALQASAQDPAATVSAYPLRGQISASPTTQISFRGIAPHAIGQVQVRGSRSGNHGGSLQAHSDSKGASWIPDDRFRQGETVSVSTNLNIAGTSNGDWSFRVGRIPSRVTIPRTILENIPPGRLRRFRSRPDLQPPHVTVNPNPKPTQPGYVFLSPKSKIDAKQAGPMIVDNAGRLIWFRPLPGIRAATDFRAQTYKGKPVLTYWDGTSRQGIGVGDLVILDQSYRQIRRFKAPNGFRPDLHEFVITPNDTAVLITYPSVRTDLRSVGGSRNGLAVDSVIQEIDIETGLVVFEWHSLGKIPLNETLSRPQPSPRIPFDYVHFNSVNLDSDGDFLASARNTWTVYKIDRQTGRIEWRLGGKRSTYRLGRGVKFAWQHDAQRRSDGAITLFDNSAFPPVRKHSRVLAIRLDDQSKRASLISAWKHPKRLLAATQGNVQNLPGGGAFVNWGSQRWFNDYDANGNVLWNARVALGFESYRGYRLPWVGTPATRPRAAARRTGSGMDVYASWNGATHVATWTVLAGSSAETLAPVKSAARAGFETRIPVSPRANFVAVRAHDASGAALATSPTVRLRG